MLATISKERVAWQWPFRSAGLIFVAIMCSHSSVLIDWMDSSVKEAQRLNVKDDTTWSHDGPISRILLKDGAQSTWNTHNLGYRPSWQLATGNHGNIGEVFDRLTRLHGSSGIPQCTGREHLSGTIRLATSGLWLAYLGPYANGAKWVL